MQFKRLFCVLIILFSFLPLGFAQDSRPMVRLIYFLPNDRQSQSDIDAKMDWLIKSVQQFYADQMEAHGFEKKTFRIETDATGKAVVHRVDGQFADAYYHSNPWEKVWDEINRRFNTSKNIYFTVLDISSDSLGPRDSVGFGIVGIGAPDGNGGRAIVLGVESPDFMLAAHELGHAFGLVHDLRENGKWKNSQKGSMLSSLCTAEWLDLHRYFNPNQTPASNDPTTVEMLQPSLVASPISIRLQFRLTDADGLYQAQLRVPEGVIACKRLSRNPRDTVEFVTTELKSEAKIVTLQVTDVLGNISLTSHRINITPLLPRPKVISIQDANLASAVRRAVGQASGTAITTRTMLNLRLLSAHHRQIRDLSGFEYATFLTWLDLSSNAISDVFALSELTRLRELHLSSNAISDVSALSELTRLENLGLLNNAISDVSALSGLTQLRHLTLAFNAISDVSALSELTRLRELHLLGNAISDVSALSGLTQLRKLSLSDNAISDVSALLGLTQLTTLHLSDNTISDISPLMKLNLTGTEWDSTTGLYLERNPLNYPSVNTYIPAMQARGVKVKFDPRTPTTLLKVSGAAQQGAVNTGLTFPFVVEVRDQQNRLFAGVPVTFSVTTGGGRLSATTVSTDATGRAKAHLTLGRTAGKTTVRVTAANVSQPVQFTATAVRLSSPVTIRDANLRAKIVETLDTSHGGTPTAADMLTLTTLTANSANIRDLTGLQHASNLTTLSLENNNISDVTLLAGLSQLANLSLNDNSISDVVSLEVLTQLESVSLDDNNLSDVTPLAPLVQLKTLSLENNNLSDVVPLMSLTQLKTLRLKGNLLSYPSLHTHIPAIQAGGATVTVDLRTPTKLVKISGTQGITGAVLPLIIEVQDENGFGFSGVPVTFTLTTGSGRLSVSNVITDVIGRARATLTIGRTPGKNTVRATAPDVLQPISFSVTAVNANSLVSVRDANLRAKIAETLGKPRGAQLTAGDMLALTRLEAPNANIQDLTGLGLAYNLTTLNLGGEYITGQGSVNSNKVSDFSPLSGLTQLTDLNLSFCSLSDMSFLSSLAELRNLHLGSNSIADISVLAGLTQLTSLTLLSNAITDLSPLSGLTQLINLNCDSNAIVNLPTLVGLTQLRQLSFRHNTISNLAPLAGLPQLISLNLYSNNISDVSALSGLTQLRNLYLDYNAISDVSALAELTQLTQLYLGGNTILDVSPLIGLNLIGTQWNSTGLYLEPNPLSYPSINTHIPAIQAKGIEVKFEPRTPTTLLKVSGAAQQGNINTALPLPFVVEVRDQQNRSFAGVPVTFSVTAGGGHLSATTTVTDAVGTAVAHLTLGRTPGTTTVRVTAADVSQPVQFTATAIRLSSPVTIPDANLRAKIVEALDPSHGGTPTAADMLTLMTLTANSANIRDLTGLEHAFNLVTLSLENNNLSDVGPLTSLTQLESLSLDDNNISNVTPIEGLIQLTTLSLDNNRLSDVSSLTGLSVLQTLSLNNNNISDVGPLTPLTQLKTLQLRGNLLSYPSLHTHIPVIQAGGATVAVDLRTPTALVKISGTHSVVGTALPIIVEVQDEQGLGFFGVPVTFTLTTGSGHLSASKVITDATGRAWATLKLGNTPGKNTVRAAAVEVRQPALFNITVISANSPVTVPDANLRKKIAETLDKPPGAQLTAGDMLTLTRLDAPNADIQNLTGLEHAHNLTTLNLEGKYITGQGWRNSNTVSDFSPLFGLAQLTTLNLSASSLSDVSFLLSLTQLKSLHLHNNKLSDISVLAGLAQLTRLTLSYNAITDLSPLSGLAQLMSLYLGDNSIIDVSPLADLTQLRYLSLDRNTIPDLTPLAGLTQLTILSLKSNSISDISPLAGLTQLTELDLGDNAISDVEPLAGLTQLTVLILYDNAISDVSPLVGLKLTGTQWNSTGLFIRRNPLSSVSIRTHIRTMRAEGIGVEFDNIAHPTLLKISGDRQEGEVGTTLANSLVVEAQNDSGVPMRGVSIMFSVTAGGGNQGGIRTPIITTDSHGRAQTTLTLGQTPGLNKVSVTAEGLPEVTFTAVATASPDQIADVDGDDVGNAQNADVDGDGVVNVGDLEVVAAHIEQADENDADVNGDGIVDITDLVLVAGAIGNGVSAPDLHAQFVARFTAAEVQQWLTQAAGLDMTVAAYRRGVWMLAQFHAFLTPKETALLANYPNPFNPETWIPYQLAQPAEVTLRIYAVNGVLVRTLALGHQHAGLYKTQRRAAYWDGRNECGERVASGIYFYTLSAGDFTATRKLLIRK